MTANTGGAAAAGPTTAAPSGQAAGLGGPSTDAPQAGKAAPAADVEVLDRDGNSLGSFDGQGKPLAPNIAFTASNDSERSADSGEQQTPHYVVKEYRSIDDEQGVTHTFHSPEKAIAKAEALGKTHVDGFDEHGRWHPISKGADGAWTRRQTVAEEIAAAGMEFEQVDTPGGAHPPAAERIVLTRTQSTALEALKAVLKKRGDSDKQIAAVTAAAVKRFQQVRKDQGLEPVVRVYDRAAPKPAGPAQPAPAHPLAHERTR